MTPVAGIFGIHNHTASMVVDLVLIVLGVLWLALIYWTFADARRRIGDGVLVACAVIVALFPFVGTLIYMIVRPPEYLADVHERNLEIQAAQARLEQIGIESCPYCDNHVEREFLRCPHCLRKLRDPCVRCGKPLQGDWKICPYCETERDMDTVMSTSQRRRRRSSYDPEQTMVAPPRPSDLI